MLLWVGFERVLLGLQPHTPKGGENLFEATTAYPLRVQPDGVDLSIFCRTKVRPTL